MVPLTQREVPYTLRRRVALALGVGLVCFLLLLARLWDLQILHGDEMRTLSENNRIRLHRLQATRGTVLDRFGRVLVDSRPAFDAVLVPEDARNVSLTLENLSQFFHQNAADMHALLAQAASRPPFEEITVKRDLSWDEIVALETHQLDLAGREPADHLAPQLSDGQQAGAPARLRGRGQPAGSYGRSAQPHGRPDRQGRPGEALGELPARGRRRTADRGRRGRAQAARLARGGRSAGRHGAADHRPRPARSRLASDG